MSIPTAKFIGGFIRWLFKGCKTRLRDEIWLADGLVNYIIGVVAVVIILGFVIWLFF